MIRHRAAIPLADDAVPVILGRGAQPDRHGGLLEQRVRLGRFDNPASRSQHHRPLLSEHVRERLPFQPAVVVLAVEREELRERHVGGLFDLAIQFHEPDVQAARELPADRGLPGAAKAEQRHHPRRVGMVVGQQIGRGHREGAGEIGESLHRDVAASGFELDEEPHRHTGAFCELADRPVPLHARRPHALPDQFENLGCHRHRRRKPTPPPPSGSEVAPMTNAIYSIKRLI